MITTRICARNATMLIMMLVLGSMAPAMLPSDAHAQPVVDNGSTVDGGGLPTPAGIASQDQTFATPAAIIARILSANQSAPRISSMSFVVSLRMKRPSSAPPNCVFEGTVKFEGNHRSATVSHRTPGLLCFFINRTIISKLFEGNEPFAMLLARFDFQVLGKKIVDGDQYYLVRGKAREIQTDPKAMTGWIDYDRGLVIDATMQYTAETIDLAQRYTSISDGWVLTDQDVNIPSLGATLDIAYSEITIAPGPPADTFVGPHSTTASPEPGSVSSPEQLSPVESR